MPISDQYRNRIQFAEALDPIVDRAEALNLSPEQIVLATASTLQWCRETKSKMLRDSIPTAEEIMHGPRQDRGEPEINPPDKLADALRSEDIPDPLIAELVLKSGRVVGRG